MAGSRTNGTRSSSRCIWVVAAGFWAASLAAGFFALWAYAATPGEGAAAPRTWPLESSLPHDKGRSTLLVFVHPRCPCSRATLRELNRLLARAGTSISPVVVFLRPHGVPPGWERTELWSLAENISGAVVRGDAGEESKRFHVETSGTCLLYDPQGALLFSGGITSVRGHEGNSFGQERILGLATVGKADRGSSPVFGCAFD